LTSDGRRLALLAGSERTLSEVYVSDVAPFAPRMLTAFTDQVRSLMVGTRELISWKGPDGIPLQGVVIKPPDFNPAKRHPLLTIIHGGPMSIDRPLLLTDADIYPADIWAARGAIILKVNYRGGSGYGERFRQMSVRNLGVAESSDVASGIDHLIDKGWVDPARVGCMGWSHGGFIAAFLATATDKCVAASVGAGITNWSTQYYNSDATLNPINYLGSKPPADPESYRKASPTTYVARAKTPMLIQHGDLDRRVPIANAYELRQSLDDRGTTVEMIVYRGSAHFITRPRGMRAVLTHNLAWFNHYLFGDTMPDFTRTMAP
jgi:dipeptidyl aminopeptidase/acylaminoacyl peptidase